MTPAKDLLPEESQFDPRKEENWHFHDEYEFWYIGFPELNRTTVNGQEYEPSRERGFCPWENIAPRRPDLAERGDLEKLREAIEIQSNHVTNEEEGETFTHAWFEFEEKHGESVDEVITHAARKYLTQAALTPPQAQQPQEVDWEGIKAACPSDDEKWGHVYQSGWNAAINHVRGLLKGEKCS